MKKVFNQLKLHSVSFVASNVYLFLLIVIPKNVSSIGPIPIRTLASFIFIGIVCYDLYKKNIRFNFKKNKLLVLFYSLFLIFAIPSLFYTYNLVVSVYTFIKFIWAFLIFIIFLNLDFTDKEYKIIINTFLFSTLLVLMYGFFQYIFDFNLFKVGTEKYIGSKGRISSTFFNTIYYGIYINLIFWYLMYWLYTSKKKFKTIFLSLLIIALYVALILTFTRSAVLVFFGIAGIIMFCHPKMFFSKRIISILLVVILSTLVIPGGVQIINRSFGDGYKLVTKIDILEKFLPNWSSDNSGSIEPPFDFEDPSLEHRKDFAVVANKIAANNVLHGVGFGAYIDYMYSDEFDINYAEYNSSKTHPHSTIVLMYSEISLLALASFSIFIILLVIKSMKPMFKHFNQKDENYYFSLLAFSITIGFIVVNIIAENAVYDSQIYPLFLIILALTFNKIEKSV